MTNCEAKCGRPATRTVVAGVAHPTTGPRYIHMDFCDSCVQHVSAYGPLNQPLIEDRT